MKNFEKVGIIMYGASIYFAAVTSHALFLALGLVGAYLFCQGEMIQQQYDHMKEVKRG